MKFQYLSIVLTDDDGNEHLHQDLRLTNADDLRAEREAAGQSIDVNKQPMGYMTIKAWAACARLKITTDKFQIFRGRIVDYAVEMREVDPTQLVGATPSPSSSPASTAPSSSGSSEPTTD